MMKIALLALLAVVAVSAHTHMSAVATVRGSDPQWPHFAQFVHDYGRDYESVAEVNEKFDNFKLVMKLAAQHSKANPLARFGVNMFADVHPVEFRRTHLMPANWSTTLKTGKHFPKWFATHKMHPVKRNAQGVPNAVDWCGQGKCTAIKDQGQCGSCWAFSATETIESAMMIAGSFKGNDLGPEQIVDCDTAMQGCGGGDPRQAIDSVNQQGGQDTEQAYPYTAGQSGQAGSCAFDPNNAEGKTSGSQAVSDGDENALQSFLQNTGPPSVCVDASSWQSYSGGVLTSCGSQIDHAVQATGIDDASSAYIVRNSWGAGWGESGYIRIQTGQNLCLIANEVSWSSA